MNKIVSYFGMVMVAYYVLLGIGLIIWGHLLNIPEWLRIIAGGAIILYALFRLKRYRDMAKQEE